jgi:hypothetical protein
MPPRALAACLTFALLASGAGCGAGGDRDDVRAVVSSYLAAAADGNGRQACAYYTAGMRRQARREARRQHMGTCARLLGTAVRYRLASLPGAVRQDVEDAIGDREEIDVDMLGPDRARATFVAPHSAVQDTRATLVRTRDGWRIERLAGG